MKTCLDSGMAMERYKPYIAMIFVQFVYAGMTLLSKAAITEGMKPHVFVVYRQAFATIALAPFAFFFEREKSAPLSSNLLCRIFFVSLCGQVFNFFMRIFFTMMHTIISNNQYMKTFRITMTLNLFYFALNYTSATLANAITNTVPATTFIIAVCLRIESISINQRHGMAKVFGSSLSLAGALVLTFIKGPCVYPDIHKQYSDHSTKSYSKEEMIKGCLMILLSSTTWSLWLIMQGPIIKIYPAKLSLTTLQCFFSCIQSAVWAIAIETNMSSWKLGWNINLLSVLYCGLIVTGITYWLQVWAVEKKGPVFTAMFGPLALVITAIFSAFIFNDTLHWGSVCGAILLVVGLYGALWGKIKEGEIQANEQKSGTNEETTLECL
ncbi:hypothetical protein RJ639_009671 [Escallonia herrerae]|uniref:WAT1-related protein n=1 Tax=Escallonia herrerae TaxID=1293975 RepID=A0AA89AQD8_9ASTE|nr:hypothetical protein RJ639_009671 [Escallonia herrerae]